MSKHLPNRGCLQLSEKDRRRAVVCAVLALKLFLHPPMLSEKQMRIMICREYLYLLWVVYYRKGKKPHGNLQKNAGSRPFS